MPFSEVTELLKLLDLWIQVQESDSGNWTGWTDDVIISQSDWEVELSCRCLFFLLR